MYFYVIIINVSAKVVQVDKNTKQIVIFISAPDAMAMVPGGARAYPAAGARARR